MTDVHAAAAATTTERPTAAAAASTIAALIGVPAESVQLEGPRVDPITFSVTQLGRDADVLLDSADCARAAHKIRPLSGPQFAAHREPAARRTTTQMIPAPAAAPLRGPPPSPTMRRIVLPGAPSAEPLPSLSTRLSSKLKR